MYLLLVIIAIVVCALLVLMVLIQNPKGGGLSSNFSSSSQLMGVQKTGDFLEKGTWILAITLMVLSLAINASVKNGTEKSGSTNFSEQVKHASAPTTTPTNNAAPLNLPASPQPTTTKPAAPQPAK
ncbi:preprotein translocase subunit SecG [Mucilaginibacter sp. X4EP1]|uniref:preprotein translocase subunit SecG n=1 Tax=Mucilaginibacter sp. X4EP1 TaxID=2723092 RepID=UPI002167F1D7|nr:preprotein translocase subunit SecG [Mucilaginibacter sp. X4EP1]MCS3813931.1 preprotein translocase subunit SecG [Mucilaginibacter sp. X4EP1]